MVYWRMRTKMKKRRKNMRPPETGTLTRERTSLALRVALTFALLGIAAWSLLALTTTQRRVIVPAGPQKHGELVAGVHYVPGRLVVQFKTGADASITKLEQTIAAGRSVSATDALSQAATRRRARSVERLIEKGPTAPDAKSTVARPAETSPTTAATALDSTVVLTLDEAEDVLAAASEFRVLPDVAYAEPDFLVREVAVPNDPYYTSSGSWGQPYGDQWGLHAINAEGAWQTTQGSSDVVVAISDSGIDGTHPELQGKLWINPGEDLDQNGRVDPSDINAVDDDLNGYVDDLEGWNWVDNNRILTDGRGHGTHVAGVIAAVTDNGAGIAGAAWAVTVMPLKGLNNTGEGTTTNLARTIRYAAENGADIINMSWAGPSSATVASALDDASARGAVLVAGVGNNNGYAGGLMPASHPAVIAVGGLGDGGNRWISSNWGDMLDVLAPAVNILSLKAAGTALGPTVGSFYTYLNGTSMSAPHVSGALALLRTLSPAFSADFLELILQQTARDISPPGRDTFTGYGQLDAAAAVALAETFLARPPAAEFVVRKATAEVDAGYEIATLRADIVNAGTTTTDLPYRIMLGGEEDGTVVAETTQTGIAPGGVVSIEQQVQLYGTMPLLTLRLDPAQAIDEYVETNNTVVFTNVLAPVTGWPVRTYGPVVSSPALADLDGDRQVEIISGSNDWCVYAWRSTGGRVSGWPKCTGGTVRSSPVIGDLDGDGSPDIVVASDDGKLYAWSAGGALLPGWPVVVGGQLRGSPALADLNGDGRMELIFGRNAVSVWYGDGTRMSGWPQSVDGTMYSAPVITDLDGDGALDIIANSNNRLVYAWHADGTQLEGWPVDMMAAFANFATPAVGDLDGDGWKEVIVGSSGRVHAWHSDGRPVAGWPRTPGGTYFNSPALADFNDDGNMEVVVASTDGRVDVLRVDGSSAAGWPQFTAGWVESSPTVVDLNNDRRPEVMVGSATKVYAWFADATGIPGWPQTTAGIVRSSPSVADINDDGRLELIIGSDDFAVWGWSLPWGAVSRLPWSMYRRDALRTGDFALANYCNPDACPDMNYSRTVDASDLAAFAAAKATNDPRGDFNADGTVDLYDQNILAQLLGTGEYSCEQRCIPAAQSISTQQRNQPPVLKEEPD